MTAQPTRIAPGKALQAASDRFANPREAQERFARAGVITS
jgi:hypothetical protein